MEKHAMDRLIDYDRRQVLLNEDQLGPYPLEKLPRVDKPTNDYVGPIARRNEREQALVKSMSGDYGETVAKKAEDFAFNYPIGKAYLNFIKAVNDLPESDVALEKAPIPQDPGILTRHIKKMAYFMGADMVGICKVPESAMYTHKVDQTPIDISMKYAIVFLVRKHMETVNASYGDEWIDDPVSYQCYQRLTSMTMVMADYIRQLGYPSKASCFDNYVTLMPQLVLESGLGEVSRLGIVLNPFVGAAFKAAAVLTDLPLLPDKPVDFGLQKYCESCFVCALQCPTQSVSKGKKEEYNGYMTWKMNEKKCAIHCTTNSHGNVCGRCTKVCPFNRPETAPSDFADWDGNLDYIYDAVNRRRLWLEEHEFEDTLEKHNKWWFPLYSDENGKISIAKERPYKRKK